MRSLLVWSCFGILFINFSFFFFSLLFFTHYPPLITLELLTVGNAKHGCVKMYMYNKIVVIDVAVSVSTNNRDFAILGEHIIGMSGILSGFQVL